MLKNRHRIGLVILVGCLLSGCNAPDDSESSGAATTPLPPTDRQTAFRVRSDPAAPLNSDQGWASEVNEVATVRADQPFRLRFEVEPAPDGLAREYRLEMRKNGEAWAPLLAEDFPQPGKLLEFSVEPAALSGSGARWDLVQGSLAAFAWQSETDPPVLQIATDDQPVLALGRQNAVRWTPVEFAVELRLYDSLDNSFDNSSDERHGARAGLVFDYRAPDDFSVIEVIRPNTVRVVHYQGDEEMQLAEHQVEIAADRWLELKAVFEGDQIEVEYDDGALDFEIGLSAQFEPRPGIYLPRQSTAAFRSLLMEGEPLTPSSSIVSTSAFDYGQPTEDLLAVSALPFSGGAGVSYGQHSPPWVADAGHGEWEFPIVIRRFSDGAATNQSGDRFDYRLVRVGQGPVSAESMASVMLEVADGHLGGTFVETPMRLGPWQAGNGDLYFLMEPSETWNALMTVKSSDSGRSWAEMDGDHRPVTGDLEGFASVLIGDRIHMLHQTSDDVWYHAFNTSDHAERPDSWAVRDERLASPMEPPTQVADLAVRSDGSIVAVYGGPDSILLRIRDSGGEWGEERVITEPSAAVLSGPSLVLGRDDQVHLAYTGSDGSAWYRRLLSDGHLSDAIRFADDLATGPEDVGSILPLVYFPISDSVSLIYRSQTGHLHERRVDAEFAWSEPLKIAERVVAQNTVDSDQTAADAVADGDTLHLLFVEQNSSQLFHSQRVGEVWSEPELLVDEGSVQWVRGAIIADPDGQRYLGFVYDAGSDGGSGLNRFSRRPVSKR